jgi:SAM-dependent methyltransferase
MIFDQRWEDIHSQRQWGVWPSEHLIRFVRGITWPASQPIVLDLGCGAGAQTRFLLDAGFYVNAVDGSRSALANLKQQPWTRAHLGTIIGDLAEFVNAPGAYGLIVDVYDLIVDVCTLQHLPFNEAIAVVQRAHKWLKPGGWFFSMQAGVHDERHKDDIEPCFLQTEKGARLMFKDYDIRIGQTLTTFSDKDTLHWIIEARKKDS